MQTTIQTIPFNKLKLTREAIMPLLGGSSDYAFMMHEYLDSLFEQGDQIFHIQGGYLLFDEVSFHQATHEVYVEQVSFDVKKVVFNMLKRSSKVAIFVCTCGEAIHDLSRQYMQEGDLLKGYVYDMFGSLVVESGMDLIQVSLQAEMMNEGLKITNRYSPGYCGWDVSQQKKLFSLFPEQFNFVQLTESCLMQPIKSVSGIIGIGNDVKYNEYTCNICDSKNCLYKNLKRNN